MIASTTLKSAPNELGEVVINIINNSANLPLNAQMDLVSDLCWDQYHYLTNEYVGGPPALTPENSSFVFDDAWNPNQYTTNTNFGLGLYKFSVWIADPLNMQSTRTHYCFYIDYRTSDLPGSDINYPTFIDINIDFDVSTLSFFYHGTRNPFGPNTTIWDEYSGDVQLIQTGLQPSKPTHLNQTATSGHPVLQWDSQPSDHYRTGYKIYRQFYPEYGFSEIGSVSSSIYTFTDNDITLPQSGQALGSPITYYVKAINGNNFLSDTSNNISIRIHGNWPLKSKPSTTDNQSTDFSISQCFPNPFNPSTVIKYSLPEKTYIEIKVFDNMGREIEQLVSGLKERGIYETEFNAHNLPSGIYYYLIKTDKYKEIKKMLLLK